MDRLRKIGNVEEKITELLHRVPGYSGYRDKENRRDEDKRLREMIAADIQSSVDRLTAYNSDLSAEREFSAISRMESLVGQTRLLADRIRTASYGYGGLFTEREVDEAVLNQLRQFDVALQDEARGIADAVETLVGSMPPEDDAVRALNEELTRLSQLFDERSTVVDEAKPSRDAQVLALLDTNAPPAPSPLMSVNRGDTLSVLGDNYVANAVIHVATDQGPLRLIRVSEDTEGATWLLGSGITGIFSARLTESAADTGGYQTLQRASARMETEKGVQEGVAVQYAARVTGDGHLELTLVFGDETRAYRGNEIRDMDVEVYGAA